MAVYTFMKAGQSTNNVWFRYIDAFGEVPSLRVSKIKAKKVQYTDNIATGAFRRNRSVLVDGTVGTVYFPYRQARPRVRQRA